MLQFKQQSWEFGAVFQIRQGSQVKNLTIEDLSALPTYVAF